MSGVLVSVDKLPVWILASLLPGCTTLRKIFNFHTPQFPKHEMEIKVTSSRFTLKVKWAHTVKTLVYLFIFYHKLLRKVSYY